MKTRKEMKKFKDFIYDKNDIINEEKCLADCEEALYSAFGSVYAGILYRGGVYHEFHAKHLQREGNNCGRQSFGR